MSRCRPYQSLLCLPQIRIAGYMPANAYAAAAMAVASAVVVNGAKVTGLMARLPAGDAVWDLWSELLGLIGLVILPQAST